MRLSILIMLIANEKTWQKEDWIIDHRLLVSSV